MAKDYLKLNPKVPVEISAPGFLNELSPKGLFNLPKKGLPRSTLTASPSEGDTKVRPGGGTTSRCQQRSTDVVKR